MKIFAKEKMIGQIDMTREILFRGKRRDNNKVIKKDKMLCFSCMEIHEVDTVEFLTTTKYKGTRLQYNAISYHCPISGDYWQDEDMITENWNRMLKEYKNG